MPTRADGKKKSLFLAQETVLAGAYFDYVVNGTNYRISYADFLANLDIRSKTQHGGLLSMQGNAAATVIASTATPVLIAGTWVSQSADGMTGSTGGRLTYDLTESNVLPIAANILASSASGAAQSIRVYIAKNGTIIDGSCMESTVSSGLGSMLSTQWRIAFELGDYIELFVENATAADNLFISRAILRVN